MNKSPLARFLNSVSVLAGVILVISPFPANARNLASVKHVGEAVVWDLTPQQEIQGVVVSVTRTPNNEKEESFIDKKVFSIHEAVVYPFEGVGDGKLHDGTYTWTMNAILIKSINKGYDPELLMKEKELISLHNPEIDSNGRETRVVGKNKSVKGRVYINTTQKWTIQSGTFRVVNGTVMDSNIQEKQG